MCYCHLLFAALSEADRKVEENDPDEWMTSTTSDYFSSTSASNFSGRGRGRGKGRGGGGSKKVWIVLLDTVLYNHSDTADRMHVIYVCIRHCNIWKTILTPNRI